MSLGDRPGPEHWDQYERATRLEPVAPERQEERSTERLVSAVGNSAFSGVVARENGGILPDGRVHAEVESAIAQRRGTGESLDPGTQARFAEPLGDSFADVRVHTDSGADALARSVDARAFATGSDIYFARGEYRPGSGEGDRLLAHELAHVVQQRGAPTAGPLVVSQPGDAQETEADTAADEIAG